MNKKFLYIAMGLLVVIVIAAIVYATLDSINPSFHGSLISPPKPAANFTLTNQNQETTRLSDFLGKYILLFFGFTNCPDECPLTMGYLKQMYDKLGNQAEDVQVILITTDPDTDTPQVMGDFLNHFDPSFIGLTGKMDDLQSVWKNYGVTVMDNGETHSSFIYLIDPRGNLMATYPLLDTAEGITADLQNLLDTK
jgi:protein SCO1/2